MSKNKELLSLKRFIRYNVKYKFQILAIIVLSVIASAVSSLPAGVTKILFDDILPKKDATLLVVVLLGYVVAIVIKGFSTYSQEVMSAIVTRNVARDIKDDVYTHLLSNLTHNFYDRVPIGEILSRLGGDAANLGNIGMLVFNNLKFLFSIPILLGYLFFVDWKMAIVVIGILPLLFSVMKKVIKKIKKQARKRQDQTGEVNSILTETVSGIRLVKAFGTEEKEFEKYKSLNDRLLEVGIRVKKQAAKVSPINEISNTVLIVAVFMYGGMKVINNQLSTGELFSFITALGLLADPLKRVAKRYSEVMDILPSAERVIELLEEKPGVLENPNAIEYKEKATKVTFEDVNFKYDNANDYAIKNVNLEVNEGEVVAFVGRSGSGKTTLVNLIPRFYDIQSGSIKLGETDIKDITFKSLRKHIGIVPQETFLFKGTILDNILYGSEEKTKEEAIEAAKKANAHNFIEEFEDSYESLVGERGAMLSGGQKQRIAIARAILKNPEIMILDEATSALDTESERLVQDALDKLMIGRTTFVIAHRLSTIINASKIVAMDNGEIKEVGTHEELLKENGIYKKLYDTQFGEGEKGIEERG